MTSESKVPQHIGIILDGNRRFAKKLMLKPWMGHEWGEKKVEAVLDWAHELGVKELTFYAFSIQNFNRPKEEFNYLMKVFDEAFEKLKDDERIDKYKIKIRFLGRIHMFPDYIQEKMKYLMEKTKNNNDFIVNFAMAYGGREEVIDAIKKLAQKIKNNEIDIEKINEEVFNQNLYMPDEPDLIIRTGGEHRTSNFLIWQSSYSEWLFIDKTWPEFEKEDLINAIEDYKTRERRFGK